MYKLEYKYSNNDDLQCMPNTHVLSLTPRFSFVKVFIGGAVTFTLGPRRCILRRIPDKNYRCIFTRGSRGEVMIFFEKNKVLGVEPNRVLNILEGI